ncbi:ABC transporter permease [Streptomyces hydrogenans]|uniref:ABC transporter permease n=1 Tax=Streptomyces hydrogenans TaxID=1873719 RepID=UPI0038160D8F
MSSRTHSAPAPGDAPARRSFRPNGLARAAVRFKPSSFVGTFVALLLAAAVVSGCGLLLQTGATASLPAARYAGVPVVAAADQEVHMTVDLGDERDETSSPVPDRARLDAALAARAAGVPGVARAVADVAFPVRILTPGGGASAPLTASGWGSTSFTGAGLASGRAPGAGEAVIGTGTHPADGSGVGVGERVVLRTPGGEREFTVSGTSGTPGVWFSDAGALAVSGHPGKVDAIAVLPREGADADAVADRVAAALDGRARVLTGDDRALAEGTAVPAARELLMGLGGSFGGVATMVAVFTAAATVALSVGQRSREFALLRAIGATPRQLRRSIATEALLVAPLAGVLGCLPGTALAVWWFGQLRAKGAVPEGLALDRGVLPYGVAVAAVVVTALLGGLLAARRPSRTEPGRALAEAQVERAAVGRVRTPLGIAALVGGTVFAGVSAGLSGDAAANTALGVVMLYMLAVALLGPVVARVCAGLAGTVLGRSGASGHLAAANSRTNARRLASAITPIVLATAFVSTLLFLHTSTDRAAEHQRRAAVTADHVVADPAGLPGDAAERAAREPGVTAAVTVLRTSVLLPSDVQFTPASAQAVSADPSPVQDLGVRTGALADLRPGTVAVDQRLADSAGVRTGERLTLRMPDGGEAKPLVVATYARGLGVAEVTLPASDLTGRVSSPYPTELLVRGGTAEGLAALGAVTGPDGAAAAHAPERELSAWANRTMAAVLGGFAAVAAANTLVMTVLHRRRELGTLRLIGTTRRQVLRMIRLEALLVAVGGLVLGSAIALATLVPMTNGLTGEAPHVPPLLYGSLAAGVVALGLVSTALPARAALRHR